MRPLILKMSAFGPFAEEVTIDFNAVAEHGIFLISGNTGAGKTTIFDAISFALYGAASGDGRDAKSVRSDFAKPECETYVELEFMHKGKKYFVYRKPEQKRPRKRGGGETTAPAEAYIRKPDESVISKYKEVTEAVVEILGIDYSQFKQIVMIAQGEFRKLLIADSNARSEIFRKLFNTQDFERLQKKLGYRSLEAKQRCDDLKKSIDQYISGIKYSEQNAFDDTGTVSGSALSIENVLDTLCEVNKKDEALYNEENIAYAEAEKVYEQLVNEYNSALKDNEDIEKCNRVADELKGLELQKDDMDKLRKDNERIRCAVYEVAPFEEKVQSIKLEVDNLLSDIENLKDERSFQEKKLFDAKSNLELWQNRQGEAEEYLTQINILEAGLGRYEEAKQLKNIQTHRTAELSELAKAEVKYDEEQQSLEASLKELRTEVVEPFANSNVEKIKAEAKSDMLKAKLSKLESLLEESEALVDLNTQLNKAEKDYSEAQSEYQAAAREFQRIDEIYYNSQVGILVAKLKDNAPCPVCGSLSHPKPAKPSGELVTKEELDKAKYDKELLEGKREQCLSKVRELEAKIKADKDVVKKGAGQFDELNVVTIQLSELGKATTNLSAKGKATTNLSAEDKTTINLSAEDKAAINLSAENDVTVYEELSKQIRAVYKNTGSELKSVSETIEILALQVQRYEEALKETESINSKLSENADNHKLLLTEKKDKEDELKEITAKLELLSSQLEFSDEEEAKSRLDYLKTERNKLVERYQQAIQEETEVQKTLSALNTLYEKLLADADNSKKKLEAALADYVQAVEANGFSDEDDYHKHLTSKAELEKREAGVKSWRDKYTNLVTQKEYYEERISGLEYKNLEDILLKKNDADVLRTAIRGRIESINIILQNNKDIYKKLKAKSSEFDKAVKEYEVASLLAKTANGDLSGKEKVKFEQYVQGVYFKQVLTEANKRLYKMSQGQYVLLKREEALDGRKHSGLEIDVFDYYTGKARSVASLSGGESFKAALSLALGLSDVIQSNNGGIDVDVMFIDEGFGSLDSESLELAVNVLQKLSDGDRLIGIISHVSELKERIERQIVIEKTSAGSRVMMVG